MSKTSWLVSDVVPGVERQPLKKLEPDATALLQLIERWRIEARVYCRAADGCACWPRIRRIALAYEAGRDGFWLARWLISRGIEAHCRQFGERSGVPRAPAQEYAHLISPQPGEQRAAIRRSRKQQPALYGSSRRTCA
jgi:hypothetical protein